MKLNYTKQLISYYHDGIQYLSISFLLIALFTSSAFAQSGVSEDAVTGYNSINKSNLKTYVEFLASEEMQGRGSSDNYANLTAKYLESQFKLSGFTPVPGSNSMLQEFTFLESRKDTSSFITLSSPEKKKQFQFLKDFIQTSSHHESLDFNSEMVFVGFALIDESINHDDFKDQDLNGKVAVAFTGSPPNAKMIAKTPIEVFRSIKSRAKVAQSKGAKAIIFINEGFVNQGIRFFKDQLLAPKAWLDNPDTVIPEIIVSHNFGDGIVKESGYKSLEILDKLKKGEEVDFKIKGELEFNLPVRTRSVSTYNVVAYLEGSDDNLKNEAVIIGAHYDHLGTGESGKVFLGADDNASGTSVILETAVAFSKNKIRPKRSLILIGFGAEELGIIGAKYYAKNPLLPMDKSTVMINLDMVGRNSKDSLFVMGSNFHSKKLHSINEQSGKIVNIKFDYKYNDLEHPERLYYRSDHIEFAKNDVPVIYYTSGSHPDYHQTSDTIDKINFEKLEKVTKLVYLTAWEVSNLLGKFELDGLLFSEN